MVKCEFLIRRVKIGDYLNDIVKNKAMFPSFGDIKWAPKIYCTYFFSDSDNINFDVFKFSTKNTLFFIFDISILKYENFLICNRWDYGRCSEPGNEYEQEILLKGTGNGIKPDLKKIRKHILSKYVDPEDEYDSSIYSHEVLFDYIPINYIKAILTRKDNIPYVKNIFKDINVFNNYSKDTLLKIYKQPIVRTIKKEDQYKIQKEIEHCKTKKEIFDIRRLLYEYKQNVINEVYLDDENANKNDWNYCKKLVQKKINSLISYIQDRYSIEQINMTDNEIIKMVRNMLKIKTKIDLIDLITILKYCLNYIKNLKKPIEYDIDNNNKPKENENIQKHNELFDILTELNKYI